MTFPLSIFSQMTALDFTIVEKSLSATINRFLHPFFTGVVIFSVVEYFCFMLGLSQMSQMSHQFKGSKFYEKRKENTLLRIFRCSLLFQVFAKFPSKTLSITRNNVLKVFPTEIESEHNIFGQEMNCALAADN